jgi:hypothetical protein
MPSVDSGFGTTRTTVEVFLAAGIGGEADLCSTRLASLLYEYAT